MSSRLLNIFVSPALLPVVVVFGLTVLGSPGILNYDSSHIYIQAAMHAGNLWWSLPFEMLWTTFFKLGLFHFGWMYLFTNALFALGGALIVSGIKCSKAVKTLVGLLIFACPVYLLISYQLLRDNLAIASLLVGFGLALHVGKEQTPKKKMVIFLGCWAALVLAAIARKDIAVAAIPFTLLFFGSLDRFVITPRKIILMALIPFVYVSTISVVYSGSVRLYYKVPPTSNAFVPSMHLDLVGMSVLSDSNLYSEKLNLQCRKQIRDAIEEYRKQYLFPWATWRKTGRPCYGSPEISKNWKQVILQNPLLYIRHRFNWGVILLGLMPGAHKSRINSWEVDLHNKILNRNLENYIQPKKELIHYPIIDKPQTLSSSLHAFISLIERNQNLFIFKAWPYGILHLIALTIGLKRKRFVSPTTILSSSGILHFIVMALATPSFSFRYACWFILSGWISFILSLQIFTKITDHTSPSTPG